MRIADGLVRVRSDGDGLPDGLAHRLQVTRVVRVNLVHGEVALHLLLRHPRAVMLTTAEKTINLLDEMNYLKNALLLTWCSNRSWTDCRRTLKESLGLSKPLSTILSSVSMRALPTADHRYISNTTNVPVLIPSPSAVQEHTVVTNLNHVLFYLRSGTKEQHLHTDWLFKLFSEP